MLKALSPSRLPRSEIVESAQPEVDTTMSTFDIDGDSSKRSVENFTPNESASAIRNVTENNTNDSLEEIYTWIDQIPFSRPRRNIARDFSDGVFMAELLKRYYPRHVDLHNYMSRSSIANKIDNWSTLNRKVLSKIGMKLGKDLIIRLAYSEPGVIETILADLRTKILKDCNADRDSLYFDYEDNGKGETVKSVLNPEEVANKTVPRHAFVKLKHELQEKKSVISTLSEKVSHLENLIKLKDQRIADLMTQITGAMETNLTPRSSININDSPKHRTNKTPKVEL